MILFYAWKLFFFHFNLSLAVLFFRFLQMNKLFLCGSDDTENPGEPEAIMSSSPFTGSVVRPPTVSTPITQVRQTPLRSFFFGIHSAVLSLGGKSLKLLQSD